MTRIALLMFAALALVVPTAAAAAPKQDTDKTIAELAAATPELSTLLSLVKQAGLADELAAPGPLTVFAPTNAAFAELPKKTLDAVGNDAATLKRVLLYHIVPGKVGAAKVVKLRSAKTLAGPTVRIRVKDKDVRINNANVIQADVNASNGVVHVIDRVMIPPKPPVTIAALAAATPQLSTLLSLVKQAGLAGELSAPGALTVYAPTNAAFAKVPKATLDALAKDPAALKRVLLYHVAPGKVSASRVVKLRSVKTVAGPAVKIRVTGKTVRVNNAKVLRSSIKASNGVVDLIDGVLIPPTIAALAAETRPLSTLLSLVKRAGLADELAGPGPLTVFAPTNAAFAKVPKATLDALAKNPAALKRVLLYHVVAGDVTAAQVVKLRSAKTLAGPAVQIRATGKTVRIDNARVTTADVYASNGVVHLIDRVLIPAS